MKRLTDLIREKGFVTGPFMKSSDPALVEIAGHAGFDFVILDMEHGPVGLQQMQNLIRAAETSGVIPVIRTRDRMAESISQALDIGAQAVQIPQLTNVEEVRMAVHAAKFFPTGERGVCRFVRAARYSATERNTYFTQANTTEIVIQVEGVEALKNFDEILEVPDVDILFIGCYDLSQSMGVPGETEHPVVIDAIKQFVAKAKAKNRYIGIFTDTPENARMWRDIGVQYLSYSVDIGIYLDACRQVLCQIT
jgi:4-hydroxy-2-oxoheptanedioate aldolase